MLALRLTESAALPKRTPSWSSAADTLVAVVHRVRLLPSTLRASGRPRRTAIAVAVVDRGVDRRDDGVVLVGLDALARQHVADVAAEGADGGLLAVDRDGDGLAEGCVGGRGADQGEDDGADQAEQQGLVAAEVRE